LAIANPFKKTDFNPPLEKRGQGGFYLSVLNPPKSPFFKGGLKPANSGPPNLKEIWKKGKAPVAFSELT
jgi:hypothetical protein